MVHFLPVAAAVRQVLPPLKLRFLQGTTHNGVAVTIHPASRSEPRTGDADLVTHIAPRVWIEIPPVKPSKDL